MRKLPRSFYLRPTLQVSRDLLEKYLVRKIGARTLVGKIVEVEAYRGSLDPASHAYRGQTKRNEVMFWEGGHLYVYFTYGMHYCANVVTREEGVGEAVLIRAVEPLEGIEVMMKKRFRVLSSEFRAVSNLTNGPAKLCQAFGIARKENGTDLTGNRIFITHGENIPASRVGRSMRIGIRDGTEHRWRFFVKGNAWVSMRTVTESKRTVRKRRSTSIT